ncbi:MAG TPA: peroxiredoxin [Candidatus Saccharimonadales bacterium]|jgi:peroxiredoxin Q/BCP|nr:peroxiredoxin [Candidatus Saccharimonadales bacterium]
MKAPDFSLPDQNGQTHTLQDYAGKWLIVYFYPMDETSGCTKEACQFRDAREVIHELSGAEVVGISKDSVESHKKFAAKHALNFPILSDPEHKTIEAYGAWKHSITNPLGTHRDTIIVNPAGEIVKEYRGVDPDKHAGEIIVDLKLLQGQ